MNFLKWSIATLLSTGGLAAVIVSISPIWGLDYEITVMQRVVSFSLGVTLFFLMTKVLKYRAKDNS